MTLTTNNNMTENFITKINIENSRNVKDLEIPLSIEHRQHLILTGKNGSGKTSLLLEINKFLTQIDNGNFQNYLTYKTQIENIENQLNSLNLPEEQKTNLERSKKDYQNWFLSFENEPRSVLEILRDHHSTPPHSTPLHSFPGSLCFQRRFRAFGLFPG